MNHFDVKVQKALKIGNSKSAVLKELKHALSVMNKDGQKLFKGYVYDADNKMIISPCGFYALEWRLRESPEMPESYHNQQTSVGTVVVRELKETVGSICFS